MMWPRGRTWPHEGTIRMAARGQPRPRDETLAPCENMGHVTERVPMAGRVPPWQDVSPHDGMCPLPH